MEQQIEVIDRTWPRVQANETILAAVDKMNQKNVDYLPVLDGDKLVGELRLPMVVRSTLMDIREEEVNHIMDNPSLVVHKNDDWQNWNKIVTSVTPIVGNNSSFVGVTSPDLLNIGFKKTLQYHLERFQTILDCTHNGIMVINNQGELTFFNHGASRMLNLNPEDVLGKSVYNFFSSTGLLEVLNSGKAQYSQRIKHNGKTFISNRTPIISDGQIMGAVAVFQDISELANISTKLELVKELNEELDAVIQCSHDGICITDEKGVILRLNPSFQRVTGLDADKYLGKKLAEILAEGVMDHSAILKVLETNQPTTLMQHFKTGKQTISTAYPIFDQQGSITRVVTNIRDITDLNLLKKELEQSKRLTNRYFTELSRLKKESVAVATGFVSQSEAMAKVLDVASRVASVDTTVLLLGESGVGKENIAQFIHEYSNRKETGSFIKINCGAIPKELLESELFGYERGAFTGAKQEGKLGYFELAHHGTLFLDEIADLPLELQVKLLRVLQEQELVRLGGEKPIKIDVRIIAATNRDLEEMVKLGQFRNDLYYRLHVVPMQIPSLRERKEDIAPLLIHFIKEFNKKHKMNKIFAKETIELLEQYSWPGNVRELLNLVERLMVISRDDELTPEHLPLQILEEVDMSYSVFDKEELIRSVETSFNIEELSQRAKLNDVLEMVEKEMIKNILDQSTDYRQAAETLGISIATLNRRIEKYKLYRRGKYQN